MPDGALADPYSPLTTEMLPVGDGHTLYVETVGNPRGRPAIYLHGGPGSGCQPDHRKLFDPTRYRAVLFDQRGAGRSTPHGERRANTTRHLVADMELIRQHLGIEKWLVVGGSWGATLALAYAQAHPDRVYGLVLRATFLGTRAELDRAFGENLKTFRPGLHAEFISLLGQDERQDVLGSYFRRILDPDPNIHRPAARAYGETERILSQVRPLATRLDFDAIAEPSNPLPATAFMEAHYFINDCFLDPGQLMRAATRLAGIPGMIVQGRYDLLCPPATAYALAASWPDASVRTVEFAGHSLSDPGISEAVAAALMDDRWSNFP